MVVGVLAVVVGATGCSTSWSQGAVAVPAPQATPAAVEVCPDLLARLPDELIGDRPRLVESVNPYVRAWGEDPVVVVCGAAAPGPDEGLPLIGGNGVEWSVDLDDPTQLVWTTVGRRVAVQVRMPADSRGAAALALTSLVRQTVPRAG